MGNPVSRTQKQPQRDDVNYQKKKCPANISMLDIYMSKSVAGCAATSSSVNTLMNYMHFGYSTMQTPLSAL